MNLEHPAITRVRALGVDDVVCDNCDDYGCVFCEVEQLDEAPEEVIRRKMFIANMEGDRAEMFRLWNEYNAIKAKER